MALTFEKKCLLCNMKEIDGNSLVDSQDSSLILCKVLNVPHLMNDLNKFESTNYCHPCRERILKIHESLEILKILEKEVLEEKYLLRLQLETNYKVVVNELNYSPWDFGVELVNEIRFKSINLNLKKAVKNQIAGKFRLKTKNYRIMKNITITEKLKHGTFEEYISKETTPLIYNIDEKPFIKNCHFVDSATNSSFNHAEFPLTSHVYNFDEIKLEFLTDNTTDIKDPLEGIVPESGFVTENPTLQKKFVCGTCETNFDDYSQLDEHFCTLIGSKSLSFDSNQFDSKVSLNSTSYSHVKNFVKCRCCVEVFPDHFSLKRHERIHTEEKRFKCSNCEKSFSGSRLLKMHERIHTGEIPFKCRYCERTFQDHSNTKSHERIHTKKKPFKCGYCDKRFRDRSTTKSHELIHTGEKPFKCGYCDKRFQYRSNTKSHERTHTEEKPFNCRYCDKTFRNPNYMKSHERIHDAATCFKCKFCGKSFAQKSSMEMHERIHTKEKHFNCGYCNKTFRDPYDLKRHKHIHENVKPFKCKFCEKNFSQKSGMETHERIHTGEKPFKCGFCVKTFRARGYTKSHERIHGKKKL